MRWFDLYGGVSRRFKGLCSTNPGAATFEEPFECIQLNDGRIYLRIDAEDPSGQPVLITPDSFQGLDEVRGQTSDDRSFLARPMAPVNTHQQLGGGSLTLVLSVNEVVVGGATPLITKRKYGLTNVVFAPSRYEKRMKPVMVLDINGSRVLIKPVRHYNQVIRSLRAQNACAVTCVAETSGPDDRVEELCEVLSIAHGSLINWIWREDYASRRRVQTTLSNRVTRLYTSLHLIPLDEPGTLPNFASQVWQSFLESYEPYRLRSIIRLMSEARQGRNSDLETRAIMLIVILEQLAGAFGTENDMTSRMPKNVFRKGQAHWEPILRDALGTAYPNGDDVNKMLDTARGEFNRVSFRQRLLALARKHNVLSNGTLADRVSKVIDTRNALVHRARFSSESRDAMVSEFFSLLEFVDRLILKLLGYSGKWRVLKGDRFVTEELP